MSSYYLDLKPQSRDPETEKHEAKQSIWLPNENILNTVLKAAEDQEILDRLTVTESNAQGTIDESKIALLEQMGLDYSTVATVPLQLCLAELYDQMGRIESAIGWFESAWSFIDQTSIPPHALIPSGLRLAQLYELQEQGADASRVLEKCWDVSRKRQEGLVVPVGLRLAAYYSSCDKKDDALSILEASWGSLEEEGGISSWLGLVVVALKTAYDEKSLSKKASCVVTEYEKTFRTNIGEIKKEIRDIEKTMEDDINEAAKLTRWIYAETGEWQTELGI